jgi:phosphoribosyl-ATP pyrophosphohydrolase
VLVFGSRHGINLAVQFKKKAVFTMSSGEILEKLSETVDNRYRELPENSYTTKLFDGGLALMGEKILEEAGEVVEAAGEQGEEATRHFVYECADLFYHLVVLMRWRGVGIEQLANELASRFGVSGLDEKANRDT